MFRGVSLSRLPDENSRRAGASRFSHLVTAVVREAGVELHRAKLACSIWNAMIRATASTLHEHYRASCHSTAPDVSSVNRSYCAGADDLKLTALPLLPMGTRGGAGTAPPEVAGMMVCLLGPALVVWLRFGSQQADHCPCNLLGPALCVGSMCGSQGATRVGSLSNKVLFALSCLSRSRQGPSSCKQHWLLYRRRPQLACAAGRRAGTRSTICFMPLLRLSNQHLQLTGPQMHYLHSAAFFLCTAQLHFVRPPSRACHQLL